MYREGSPEVRALRARIAAAERWGRTADRQAATAPARRGMRAKFEREADPDGVLPPDERERRVDHLMHAHMLRMALASAKARSRRAAAREIEPTPQPDLLDDEELHCSHG